MSEDLLVSAEVIIEWSPNELHFPLLKPSISVLVIKSAKEPSIKPHVCEEPRICRTVPKGIDMPSYSGPNSKLIHEELVAVHHVINHVFIVSACLIMH